MRWALAFALCLSSIVLAQQAPPTGDGSISVTVVADATGRPVKGANVIAIVFAANATLSRNATTDRNGRALILGLPEGRVRLSASHPGFVGSILGQNSPNDVNGTYLTLTTGQRVENLTLRLKRGGAIGGIVTDEAGDPIVGVSVSSYRRDYVRGRLQFTSSASDTTDDRGAYRIAGLTAGTYLIGITPVFTEQPINDTDEFPSFLVSDDRAVVLTPQSPPPSMVAGQTVGLARTYYPGVRGVADASPIAIQSAEQRDGINFHVESVRITRLAGRLVGPPGTTIEQAHLALTPDGVEPIVGVPLFTAQTEADGKFGFPFVPFGNYTIVVRASAPNPGGATGVRVLWAALPVAVSDSANNVNVLLNEGMTFAGRVNVAEASSQKISASWRVVVQAQDEATEFKVYASNMTEDGQFMIACLPPNTYSVSVSGAPSSGPYIASVMVDGRDVLDFGLRIEPGHDVTNATVVLRNALAEVTGTVRDQQDAPTTLGSVVLFPADSRYWTGNSRRVIAQRPDINGHFQFRLLPAGEYLIAAADVVQGQAQDPAFLEQLRARATQVSLTDTERKTIDVKRRE